MESFELEDGSRVKLYLDRVAFDGEVNVRESGVIDLSGNQAALVVVGEVVFANERAIFARLRDLPRKGIFGLQARLIYATFSESYERQVVVEPASDLGVSACALRVLSPWQRLNRRAYVRVPVEFSVRLNERDNGQTMSLLYRVKDMSNSGIGVLVQGEHALVPGMEMRLELHLSDGLLEVEATVASVRDGIVGFQFTNLRPEAERRVGRTVFHAQVARKRLLVE